MEDAFNKLKGQGKNTLDGVIQWMKDANIIDDSKLTEVEAKKGFEETDNNEIDFEGFQQALNKLGTVHKKNIDALASGLQSTLSQMEDAFEKLKKEGKNDVDNIVQWMKDFIFVKTEPEPTEIEDLCTESLTKIIDTAKEAEERARKLFEGADSKNIDLEKFKEAIRKIAEEQKKSVEDITKTLAEQGPRFLGAVQAGASAFKEAMTKK